MPAEDRVLRFDYRGTGYKVTGRYLDRMPFGWVAEVAREASQGQTGRDTVIKTDVDDVPYNDPPEMFAAAVQVLIAGAERDAG